MLAKALLHLLRITLGHRSTEGKLRINQQMKSVIYEPQHISQYHCAENWVTAQTKVQHSLSFCLNTTSLELSEKAAVSELFYLRIWTHIGTPNSNLNLHYFNTTLFSPKFISRVKSQMVSIRTLFMASLKGMLVEYWALPLTSKQATVCSCCSAPLSALGGGHNNWVGLPINPIEHI